MVAVVTGNDLGLFQTSWTQLGALGGGAGLGTSGGSQVVNLATGNLILGGWDESLFGHGFATGMVRTYNSLGSFGTTGADGWQSGYERTVRLASGTVNTAGSTVERVVADGSVVAYAWDATRSAYVSPVGDGAHDTIVKTGSGGSAKWLWTEGSSQVQETYNASTLTVAGKLEQIKDLATAATYVLTYTGSLLTTITGANGETLEFGYDGSNRLTSVSTRERNASNVLVLKGQVSYGYDSASRLSWVQTDLTPDNGADNTWDAATSANNDGKRYRTTYTYADATSIRITGVTTSDGLSVSYTYDANGRIASVIQGGAGDYSTQTLTYTYNGSSTTVTDGSNRGWIYAYDGNKQLTSVTEPAVGGQQQVTTYTYDASGNVTRISQAPTVGGSALLDTVFQYDSNGNLTLQRDRLGNTIVRTYTTTNKLQTEARYTTPDADGLDPTYVGTTNLPSGALITRYVYDSTNLLLRFVINPAGEVSEQQYNASGVAQGLVSISRRFVGATYDTSGLGATAVPTLTAMTTWATTNQAQAMRADYSYDGQGRLSQRTDYATVDGTGAGTLDAATAITRYTYDPQGLLRQQVTVRGAGRTLTGPAPSGSEVVDYVYDGLGRLLSTLRRDSGTASNDDTNTIATVTAYVDSMKQIVTTFDTGAIRTEVRNAAGMLISVSEAGTVSGATVTRTTQNVYDNTGRLRMTQDAGGGRSYFFYDTAGRLSAIVDATGAVTQTLYDGIGRTVGSTTYATRVTTTGWFNGTDVVPTVLKYAATMPSLAGNEAWVPTDATNDRTAVRTYDSAGRLATQVDAAGLTTTYAYDGANRLLSTTVNKPGDGTVTARVTRYFYDSADRQVAVLDAAGYLTETAFDAGGRAVKTTRYATVSQSNYLASGTLTQLRPSTSANDQITRLFYDTRGNQIGVLDAEGYLTEFIYDEAANQRATKAYAKQLTGLSGSETFATLRSSATTGAPSEPFRLTQRGFNGLGQLVTELDPEGTVTRYSYDEAGRLVRTEWAQGQSEVRENNRRYDVFGNLIAELSGEQSAAALTALGLTSLAASSVTPAQLNAAFAYGTQHSYDLLGRRIESTDVLGNKTWYFYDAQSRLTFTVKGIAATNNGVTTKNALGEVTETRYSAFGQVTDTLAYTGRITIAGTQTRADVQNALNVLTFVAASDTRRQFTYDRRGLLVSSTDAESVTNNYSYTAFGQLWQEQRAVSTSAAVTVQHTYDQRGLETSRIDDSSPGGLARTTSQVFDAFGRVTSTTDGTGSVRTFVYDRLGRQISRSQTVEGRVETWATAYDAFSRVVSLTDALTKVTTLAYSDSARTVTVTSPEAIVTVTTHSRFGQTVSVKDGTNQTTTYTYNRDGQLLTTTNPLGAVVEDNKYDQRGLMYRTINGAGNTVDYTFDAVGRVLTRVEDAGSGKLNLTTSYTFDGQGRQVSVTDPAGRLTTFTFDREGRLTQQAVDPTGLNLRTSYTWDAAGRQLTVVEGVGTNDPAPITTAYTYDALGRRITEVRGSGSLNLTTTYVYDADDNVIAKQDATGNWTRYGYDEANRLRFTLSAAGNLTQTSYDADGRIYKIRQYANLVSMTGVTSNSLTLAQLQTLATNTGTQATDLVEYRVYNNDGQMRYRIDGAGNAVAFAYDNVGRVTIEKHYAVAILPVDLPAALQALEAGSATTASLGPVVPTTAGKDQWITRTYDAAGRVIKQTDALGYVTRFLYDGASQLIFSVDAVGGVTKHWYDAAGREVATRRYATAITTVTDTTTVAQLQALLTTTAADQQSYTVLDASGLVRHTINGANGWVEYTYDAAGRRVSSREHADLISVDATLQGKLYGGTALSSMPTVANNAADRCTYWVYNEMGQVRYSIDSAGYAKAYGYDRAGRQTAYKAYAVALNFSTDVAGTSVRDRLTAGTVTVAQMGPVVPVTAGTDRTTYTAFDGAGRPRYLLTYIEGGQATVSEWRYDAAGHQTEQVQYAVTIAFAYNLTVSQITSALTAAGGADPTQQRRTTQSYDGVGRLKVVTDNLGQTEQYGYDAASNRTSYTNKLGSVWTYSYDAIGQLKTETSPSVIVARFDSSGALVANETSAIVTTMTYDAVGNVLTRTENAGATDVNDRRTTTYAYDGLGHQIKTIFPDAWQVDASGALVATGVLPEVNVTYNALGQAVVQKDVLGNYAYKVYDTAGQLTYDVDASGYVSAFTYDAFGQQIGLTRYANKLTLADGSFAGWTRDKALSAAQVQSILSPSTTADRTLVVGFDLRGNKTSVTQGSITYYTLNGSTSATSQPRTEFQYDGFGNLVKESVLLEGVAGQPGAVWAYTFHYYDLRGNKTLSVDGEGYVTAWSYSALGQVLSSTEYAKSIATAGLTTAALPGLPAAGDATSGYNRVTTFEYDALGRKAKEIYVGRHYWNPLTSQLLVKNVETAFEYDKVDHLVATYVEGVKQSDTAYDALGRVTSVTEQARDVLASTWQSQIEGSPTTALANGSLYVSASPYTAIVYDAFGNTVQVSRSALGKQGGTVASSALDQVTTTRFDRQGRAAITTDAAGKVTWSTYDKADNVLTQRYTLTDSNGNTAVVVSYYSYDASNRQVSQRTERTPYLGTMVVDSQEAVAYNAFGEITAKARVAGDLSNASLSAQYEYDAAGRLVRTNAEGGVYRRYGYNLAGVQVREERDWTDAGVARTAVYRNTVDKLGRVTATVSPSYGTDYNLSSTASAVLDRWGSVLSQTDARGYVTSYQYNEQGQVTQQVAPSVTVLSDQGVASVISPTSYWRYDAVGRLLAEVDANGNARKYEYDAANRLIRRIDAVGSATRMAYDALGQSVASEDARGYITYLDYDKGGRIIAQGDYLLTLSGAGRHNTPLQRFVLDQNGNRLTVKDALDNVQRYDFDSNGQLVRSQTATGIVTTYAYDSQGRKTSETTAVGSSSWGYDYFGRVTSHTDLGSRSYSYGYDSRSGLLTSTGVAGATRTIAYNANGSIRSITEGASVFTYEYDAVGNRTLEKTVTTDGQGTAVSIETRSTYDAHNRLSRVWQDDIPTSTRILDESYDYDAVGNRRRVTADTSYGPGATPVGGTGGTPNHQVLWFTYDGENRVLVFNGVMNGTTIDPGLKKSFRQTYDAVGNVSSVQSTYDSTTGKEGTTFKTSQMQYTLRGELKLEYHSTASGSPTNGIQKTYRYDDVGHLIETTEYYSSDATRTATAVEIDESGHPIHEPVTFAVGGWLKHHEDYVYDADGRLIDLVETGRLQFWAKAWAQDIYDGYTITAADITEQQTSLATLSSISKTTYTTAAGATGYDAAGRLITHRYLHYANGEGNAVAPWNVGAFNTVYTHAYIGQEGWLESGVTGDTDVSTMRDGNTASVFDSWGRRTTLTEVTPLPDYQTTLTSKRYFASDAEGNILSRRDGTMENGVFTQSGNGSNATPYNPAPDFITATQWNAMTDAQRKTWQGKGMNQHFVYVNGQQIGRINEAGLLDAASQLTAFDSSETGTGQTSVTDGDTLQSIAERVYGNGSLWYVLADANAVTNESIFTGQILKVPQVQTNKNDASTFKPYNPAEVTGPTAPSTPYIAKPQPHECNMMASIIRIFAVVVAIAVPGIGFWAGAAIAGIGEAAAQTIEIQDGDRQGYNGGAILGSALMGGLSGGPLKGLGEWAHATDISKAAKFGRLFVAGAAQSVMGSLATAVFNKALGEDPNFSWRQVAAGAVAAGLASNLESVSLGKGGTGTNPNAAVNPQPAFNWKVAVEAAGKAIVKDAIGYGVSKLIVGEARWSWAGVAASVATEVLGAAAGSARAQKEQMLAARARSQLPGFGTEFSVLNWAMSNGNPFASDDSEQNSDAPTGASSSASSDGFKPSAQSYVPDVTDVSNNREAWNPESDPSHAEDDQPSSQSITVGSEGRRGYWGVAKARLRSDANNQQIQDYALRLMSANPDITTLRIGDQLLDPGATGEISRAARTAYAADTMARSNRADWEKVDASYDALGGIDAFYDQELDARRLASRSELLQARRVEEAKHLEWLARIHPPTERNSPILFGAPSAEETKVDPEFSIILARYDSPFVGQQWDKANRIKLFSGSGSGWFGDTYLSGGEWARYGKGVLKASADKKGVGIYMQFDGEINSTPLRVDTTFLGGDLRVAGGNYISLKAKGGVLLNDSGFSYAKPSIDFGASAASLKLDWEGDRVSEYGAYTYRLDARLDLASFGYAKRPYLGPNLYVKPRLEIQPNWNNILYSAGAAVENFFTNFPIHPMAR